MLPGRVEAEVLSVKSELAACGNNWCPLKEDGIPVETGTLPIGDDLRYPA
jgi:hypothetical protein